MRQGDASGSVIGERLGSGRGRASVLARRLTERLILLVGLLFLVGTFVIFLQMRDRAVAAALDRLRTHSADLAAGEEARFAAIADIERRARTIQAQQIGAVGDSPRAFDAIFPQRPDGTRRGLPTLYTGKRLDDGTLFAGTGAFVAPLPLTDDRRRLLLAALGTLARLTPGLPADIDNLYFFTPQNDIVIFAPTRSDKLLFYRETAPATLDLQKEEPAINMAPRNNPGRHFRCTGLRPILYDRTRHTWTTGCMTPVDRNGVHVGSWGVSLLIGRLFEHTTPHGLPGARIALVSNTGRLIWHPRLAAATSPDLDTTLDLTHATGEFAALWRVVRAGADPARRSGFDRRLDAYYAIAPVRTPGWQAVSYYPRAVIDAEASRTAASVLLVGLLGCVGLALLLRAMLRGEVGQPLLALRDRAERLIAAPGNDAVAVVADDASEVEALNQAFDIMEAAVRRERTRLTRSFELLARNVTSVAIIVLDAQARVAEWNNGAAALTGYPAEAIIGQSATLLRGDDAAAAAALATARAGSSAHREGWCQRRDGSRFWAVEILEPLRAGDDPAITGFALLLRDDSERREDELRRQEAIRLLTLAEETGESGHWRIDLADGGTRWSDRARAMLGPDATDLATSFGTADQPGIAAALAAAAAGEASHFTVEASSHAATSAETTPRRFEIRGQVETDGDGTIVALFGIVRDITAAVAAREALIVARDEARAAAQAHADLLAMVSHEIRTPMTGILGLAELGGDGADVLATIRGSARMLMTILDDVLDHSTLDAGRLVLELVPVDLAELVTATVALFEPAARRAGLRLDTHVAPGSAVLGDRTRLQQILSNLISNALKFTERGGITITLTRTAGKVTIAVADTGIGIDPAVADRLFQPFTQAETSTRRRFGGTGLGLSICRRLAEAMGGTIAVTSRPGEGSRFDVVLPLPAVDTPPPAPRPAAAGTITTAAGTAPRLLVVDDTGVTRELVRAYASQLGCVVTTAADGLVAIERLVHDRFDMVLLDWQMPGLPGPVVGELARLLPGGRTPIFAFTASVRGTDPALLALTDGALAKPFTLAMLREALVTGLAVRRPPAATPGDPLAGLPDDVVAAMAAQFRRSGSVLAARFLAALAADDSAAAITAARALKGAASGIGEIRLANRARFAEILLAHARPTAAPWLAARFAHDFTTLGIVPNRSADNGDLAKAGDSGTAVR